MSDNKLKVIGVRFDDITAERLNKLAAESCDSVSGIIRRATQYCLPLFEKQTKLPLPAPEWAAVPECQPVTEPEPDIFSVILKGNSNVSHARNKGEIED